MCACTVYIYIYSALHKHKGCNGSQNARFGSIRYSKKERNDREISFLMNSLFIKTHFFTLNNDGDMLNDYTIIL